MTMQSDDAYEIQMRKTDAAEAEVERLRALLQKIKDLAGSDSLEALDEAIAIAKTAHEQRAATTKCAEGTTCFSQECARLGCAIERAHEQKAGK